jgi:hypothetical protein
MKFLEIMLTILGGIGIALLALSIWFVTTYGVGDPEEITFKFNLLTFITGLAYIGFILIVRKLTKK